MANDGGLAEIARECAEILEESAEVLSSLGRDLAADREDELEAGLGLHGLYDMAEDVSGLARQRDAEAALARRRAWGPE